jgi:predicted protein tyrosine phosphatase
MKRDPYPPKFVLRRRTFSEFIIPERWLFVCSMNYQRSPTAEHVARSQGFWADSCGTDPTAGKTLTRERVDWADVIVCMSGKHVDAVRRFTQSIRVFNWNIRDDFDYMDAALIGLCAHKMQDTKIILDRMDEEAQAALARDAVSQGAALPRYSLGEPEDR